MLKSVIIWLNFWCNFRCNYCEVWKSKRDFLVPEASKWLDALNQFPKLNVDLTGGEPSAHPAFYKILHGLRDDITIGITTNLSLLKIDKLPLTRDLSITCSLHPTQFDRFPFEKWLEKLRVLKSIYKNLTVNYVAWTGQLKELEGFRSKIEAEDVRFHVDSDQNQQTYTPEQQSLFKEAIKDDRSMGRENFKVYPRLCTAGMTHVHILPNGDLKRCYYGGWNFHNKLGNLFTGFKLHDTPMFCNPKNCGGCDLDKIEYLKLKDKSA